MLTDIKGMLLESPGKIVELLEKYDFCHINLKSSEIRFARNEAGGQNISIRLHNNDGLYVKDFVNDEPNDIVAFIMKHRGVTFKEVLFNIKKILGLGANWKPQEKKPLFAGFYDSIGTDTTPVCEEYPDDIMDQYDPVGNKRWVKDGIPLSIQRKYDVRYDSMNDLIVFPWRSALSGAIIAVKARVNYTRNDDGPKYFYPHQGTVSYSLFGYSENYDALQRCDHLIVYESEKSVMISEAFGYRNSVAIGSHSLSEAQARLIMSLDPKEVWLMLDKDLDLLETKKNAEMLKQYMVMRSVKIRYWDWTSNDTVCAKGSPVDMGLFTFDDICKKEMKEIQ